MLDIFLKVTSAGSLVPSTNWYAKLFHDADYPPDTLLRAKLTKPRNKSHNGKLFACLPDLLASQSKFSDVHRLRAYLTVKAGYADEVHIKGAAMPDMRILKELVAPAPMVFVTKVCDGVIIKTPQSLKWDGMDQSEFEPVYEAIAQVMADEFRFDIDAWAEMKKDTEEE